MFPAESNKYFETVRNYSTKSEEGNYFQPGGKHGDHLWEVALKGALKSG
jgi:hypothetical protein